MFCHFCGFLGHDLRNCAGYFTATKKGNTVQVQYGDWLKAVGGRPRSPPKRSNSGASEANPKDHDRAEGVFGKHSVSELVQTAAVIHLRNPSEETLRGEGNNDNPRISPDFQPNYPVFLGNNDAIMERMVTEYVGSDTEDQNLNLNAVPEHVDSATTNIPTDGPVIKPKPKWTRIPRIGDRPKTTEENKTHAYVGKKRTTPQLDGDDYEGLAATRIKQQKVDEQQTNFIEKSARVDAHPCRKQ